MMKEAKSAMSILQKVDHRPLLGCRAKMTQRPQNSSYCKNATSTWQICNMLEEIQIIYQIQKTLATRVIAHAITLCPLSRNFGNYIQTKWVKSLHSNLGQN